MDDVSHAGGCHCGAVRLKVRAPRRLRVQRCSCSICRMTGFQHLIVPSARFSLLTPRSALTRYRFNTGVAEPLFCSTCGVKSFYVPRSNPDGYSVNLRCLEQRTVDAVDHEDFDGQNRERYGDALAALSRPVS